MRRPVRGLLSVVCLSACVLGARGERPFSRSWSLDQIDTVRIALPDTPLPLTGCDPTGEDCARLEIAGLWLSVAGTKKDAKKNTERGTLHLQDDGGFALVTAAKSLMAQDLLDLEIEDMRMPSDRDLELATGVGDVEVQGMEGAVSVEVDVGYVDLDVGEGNVLVRTGNGVVTVQSAGITDLATGNGGVELLQDGGARDATIATRAGNIYVELASDSNLHLHIHAPGRIDVKTDQINTVTSDHLERETGNGTTHVELVTDFGNVAVRMYDPG